MPPTFEQVTASRVRYLRERHGWTQQDLADKLVNFGMPIDRAQIARLELGKRGISLDEAMRLAFALNVAPIYLITDTEVPADPDIDPEPMQIIPGSEHSPAEARAWIVGKRPMHFQDPRSYYMNVPRAEFERYHVASPEEDR
jgi:transcriptional regulator with XRE-family HTH domain